MDINNTTMGIDEICRDPTVCDITSGEGNVGLAFGLTIGAGLATTLGAMLPFIPFIKRANTVFLSVGLALAAGVMLYVSFTEIWTKSQDNFCCVTPQHFDLAVNVCFFGGVIFTVLLDVVAAGLQRLDCGCKRPCCKKIEPGNGVVPRQRKNFKVFFRSRSNPESVCATNVLQQLDHNGLNKSSLDDPIVNSAIQPSNDNGTNHCLPHSDGVTCHDNIRSSSPVSRNSGQNQVSYEQHSSECNSQQFVGAGLGQDGGSVSIISNTLSEGTNHHGGNTASVNELFSNTSLLRMNAIIPETASLSLAGVEEDLTGEAESVQQVNVALEDGNTEEEQVNDCDAKALGPMEFKEVTEGLDKDTEKLHRMGLLTALAIGLHNFPEGMATFVAALASPSLGIALAIAIALHNIPEGLCVAMPVYYATGSRFKGFLWAFLSGVSEPIGALLGWLILKDVFGPLVFGISFGLIAGMMVFISLKELLPMAYKFDKSNGRLVALFLALGMLIMALSLILFLY